MGKKSEIIRTALAILTGSLLLVALYLTSLHSYLLFHSLIELFTIVVAAGIFVIAWNARRTLNNNYLLFIGVAFVFVALLDLIHTLAYKGMSIFTDRSANPATQLWIAARYLQSVSLLIAPLFLGRKLKVYLQIAAYTLVTGLLFGSIFYWRIFPVAYVDGVGLTTFKKVSEYVISSFFLASIGLLLSKRQEFDPGVLRYLALSLALTIGSELAFTEYVGVYGGANMVGHFLRLIAYYFLYKAIIETGLVRPYAILLRDLKRSEERLREEAAVLQVRNEELDAYAHTVAHDLKNPLTTIIASTGLITDVGNLTPQELDDCAQQIKSTAFDMDDIIDNLLLLSEVRKTEAPSEVVDMNRAVSNIVNHLNYLIKERQARVICPKSWPAAIGYGPWVEEVWANYLSNALKYGGPSPCVELGASPDPDGMIRFWARDSGPGLSPEAQVGLFTPFNKLRKNRKSGHGLGLSIVLHIVEKLGGQVGVQSEVGKGSLFFFTLPAAPTKSCGTEDGLKRTKQMELGAA